MISSIASWAIRRGSLGKLVTLLSKFREQWDVGQRWSTQFPVLRGKGNNNAMKNISYGKKKLSRERSPGKCGYVCVH